ncbi:hypothetical protein DB741_09900 [Edwardsiella ictaluri]|uniref:hypothetical protein n=1 Tax=Edwardsiella ictaluri TaxID=67780 RepID=UPI001CF2AE18|nr:hypothetical protein [Edwardsiella ictaluri]UCQ46423.1 hypothetical protein DB741_09900 [Edwardsiella ictaluri]WFO12597.1 hypothetical protein MAY82_16455 [Edwardsiella ictaluri]
MSAEFHFAFIAPYPQLATLARQQAAALGCRLTVIDGAFDTVARQVARLPDDISAVISRGGTAEKSACIRSSRWSPSKPAPSIC